MQATKDIINLLPPLQKILVVGSGGRENALAWALSKSEDIKEVFVSPGNGGTEDFNGCYQLKLQSLHHQKIIEACKTKNIDLVVIGPEAPLAEGLADKLREKGLWVFGPNADGAQIEASKQWAKELMQEADIPTANYFSATSKQQALSLLDNFEQSLVVKANGLASGKGVTVCESKQQAVNAINEAFEGRFGIAGTTVVLEERLQGPEVSVFALSDGEDLLILPTAQDHKRLLDGDKGPNTGGMGAYAPATILTEKEMEKVKKDILKPTLKALKNRGINYRGVIYAGLMITSQGAKVIEFNCRFGDPECQALMPLMGPEFAKIIQACSLGSLKKAPKLTINKLFSACVVAAAAGYPEQPKKGDLVHIPTKSTNFYQVFQAGTKKNNAGKIITSGGRVLSVVAQGKSFEKAFMIAYQGLSEIQFEGINYRSDIGNQVRQGGSTK